MSILITGGLGYIGSHCALELLKKNSDLIIIDNLSNADIGVLSLLEKGSKKNIRFIEADLTDFHSSRKKLEFHSFQSVIHFAASKSINDSIKNPLEYYFNNITSTINVLRLAKATSANHIIFSSTASVYGSPQFLPITEEHRINPENPYASSKVACEMVLEEMYKVSKGLQINVLRYFNPVGYHPSGIIKETPVNRQNNLFPAIKDVLDGSQNILQVYGNDYNTPDGTGIRDYIHIMDLVDAHLKALDLAEKSSNEGNTYDVFNIGTGIGHSVLDIINCFRDNIGISIPYEFRERRQGDVDICYADPSKANSRLNWKSKYDLSDMCRSIL